MRRSIVLASLLTLAASLGPVVATPVAAKEAKITDQQALAVVLAETRRDGDRARDQYRHPAQTLAFMKVCPGMTVVDYMPSSGWWTRVLVPYLGENGRYIGLNPDVSASSDSMKRGFGNLGEKFPAQAASWTGLSPEQQEKRIAAYNTDSLPDSLKGKVDRVLIFREMHNLWRANLMRRELLAVRDLLNDDGLLGIEQHRARAKARAAYTDGSKGYLREKDVIAFIEAHGFELVGKSEINANKKDPADHKDGVWTLPPNLRGVIDAAEKARLIEIGESDRMTLLFRKRR